MDLDSELKTAWRRGAIALAVPGSCLLVLALLCLRGAVWRELWNVRGIGVVADLNQTEKGGCQPTIEYLASGKTYRFQTAWTYSAKSFNLGQQVTVLYPPGRLEIGMLGAFSEVWPLPIGMVVVSLVLLALAWKSRNGFPPLLHGLSGFGLFIIGAVFGMSIFSFLCVQGGLEIFAGAPPMVSLVGGMLLFFGLLPTCALVPSLWWHHHVPARCPRCRGGFKGGFVGKQLTYRCETCGYRQ